MTEIKTLNIVNPIYIDMTKNYGGYSMYYLYSILAGVIIAVMVAINGSLANYYGLYSSTVIIHMVGTIFTLLIMIIKKERPVYRRTIPFWVYTGGIIGVTITICNNLAFGRISVTALLALTLLGQSITSILIDHYGCFRMQQHQFRNNKLFGLLLTLLGIILMMFPIHVSSITAIFVSLLSGVSIVLARTVNAVLAERSSVLNSTFFNFLMGLVVGLIVFFLFGRQEPITIGIPLNKNLLLYTGGFLSIFSVSILNIVVAKISSFYMTLLMFVGQVFSAVLIDAFLQGAFSMKSLLGGILVGAGLCFNLWVDYKGDEKESS